MAAAEMIFILAAPSGGGKTSLAKALLQHDDRLLTSVSHTTRAQREGEEHGLHYHFCDHEHFTKMNQAGAFVETSEVFSHLYGTSKAAIAEIFAQSKDVLLDIDWLGAKNFKKMYPQQAVSIFIMPPSLDALEARLCARDQDDEDTIKLRMQQAQSHMQHYVHFDYVIINNDFDQSLAQLRSIITAERHRCSAMERKHQDLFKSLLF